EQLTLSRTLLEKAKAKYEFGGTTKRLVLRQQVLVNADSSSVASRKLDVTSAVHTLNVALGRSPAEDITIVPDTLVTEPQHEPGWWFEQAKKHNAGIAIADIRRSIAVSQEGIAKAAFWPVLSAGGSHTQYFGDTEQSRSQIGLNLGWTIFNGFKPLTTAQNATLDRESAELSFEQKHKKLEALVYQQWERLNNAYEQTLFEREAVTLASQSLEISKEQYSMGAISDIELREAQLSLTQSRVRLESALFQYKVTQVQLEQLAGELRL
ncbi:MAG: hypothetical protein GF401_13175, partial [Chitinivibrionales bacterium]|nr:hypothetical protein [Chitinivibrionales bacterium]